MSKLKAIEILKRYNQETKLLIEENKDNFEIGGIECVIEEQKNLDEAIKELEELQEIIFKSSDKELSE